MKRAISSE
jgi:hypothetical protein